MNRLFFLILFLFSSHVYSAKIVAGPMLGHSDFRSQKIWLALNEFAQFDLTLLDSNKKKITIYKLQSNQQWPYIVNFEIPLLEPATKYYIKLGLKSDNIKLPDLLTFKTQKVWKWRGDAPDFRFAAGSCLYTNQKEHDRPGTPYGDTLTDIFNEILKKNPEFFLWLGDNIYLRETDWNSYSGIIARYMHTRMSPILYPFLFSLPQYATWDDHDFGPNNADRSFPNKNYTKKAFDLFWANSNTSIIDGQSICSYFQWYDADFFLLDDRWFRTPNDSKDPNKTILGQAQIQWIKEALLNSKAKFKFVAVGSQFLNSGDGSENFIGVPDERQDIISYIYQYKIKNVVFLTGDRHHSEISILEEEGHPRILDLTISPLSSGVHKGAEKENNPLRKAGSMFNSERNFGVIDIKGNRKERKLVYSLFDKSGKLIYEFSFDAQ